MIAPELDLLDWKRQVFKLYAAVRAAADPEQAWHDWRAGRDELFRTHPQSPLTEEARATFSGLDYFAYDPALRLLGEVEPAGEETREIAGSAGSVTRFRRFGLASFELGALELYWLEGYGGGVFLPFRDATAGRETYGGGRYLLDTVGLRPRDGGRAARARLQFRLQPVLLLRRPLGLPALAPGQPARGRNPCRGAKLREDLN